MVVADLAGVGEGTEVDRLVAADEEEVRQGHPLDDSGGFELEVLDDVLRYQRRVEAPLEHDYRGSAADQGLGRATCLGSAHQEETAVS